VHRCKPFDRAGFQAAFTRQDQYREAETVLIARRSSDFWYGGALAPAQLRRFAHALREIFLLSAYSGKRFDADMGTMRGVCGFVATRKEKILRTASFSRVQRLQCRPSP